MQEWAFLFFGQPTQTVGMGDISAASQKSCLYEVLNSSYV